MSDSDEGPADLNEVRSSIKSIFETDKRSTLSGPQSLAYDGGRAKKEEKERAGPSASGNTVVKTVMASCYKGEHHVGVCATVLMVTSASLPFVVLVDRERRPQCRVRVDAEMQLLQNNNDLRYATIYDPSIGLHWTLMYKTASDCSAFVAAVMTTQHYALQLNSEAPQQHWVDLTEQFDGEKARKGDVAKVAMRVWLLQRVGSSSLFSTGKEVEEIPLEAPRTVVVGNGAVMQGVEEALPATAVGTRRLLFLQGKRTRVARALGNPEIGPNDTAVVLLTVVGVTKSDDLPALGDSTAEAPPAASKQPERFAPAIVAPTTPTTTTPVAPPAPKPANAAPAVADTNTLLQTMLLQTLTMQQQARAPPPEPAPSGTTNVLVERSLDRLHQQMTLLYEKIDRLEIEKKIAANNEVLERIVKKAVGKMPVSDVDIEDMAKDRDQLLAKIESQKVRIEEMTDRYHKALEQLGQHKEVVSALKNDLKIQHDAAEKALEELKSRRRLEGVDAEVKHRRELDKAVEDAFRRGREEGYRDGYNSGKVDAMTIAGSATTDELRKMIDQKEIAIVDCQRRVTEMESKHYEERRQHGDQVSSLQALIQRFEHRELSRQKELADFAVYVGKAMKRIMNDTYGSVEAQIYAMGQSKVATDEVLQLLLMTIKQEARQAIDEFKREAAARASAPHLPEEEPIVVEERAQPPKPPAAAFSFDGAVSQPPAPSVAQQSQPPAEYTAPLPTAATTSPLGSAGKSADTAWVDAFAAPPPPPPPPPVPRTTSNLASTIDVSGAASSPAPLAASTSATAPAEGDEEW